MWRFIAGRAFQLFFTFIVALTVIFVIPRLLPGDPARFFIGEYVEMGGMTEELVNELRERFGLNKSYLEQFVLFVTNTFQGYFGVSWSFFPREVLPIILERLPWTLALMVPARILSFLLAYFMGTMAAWKREGKLDVMLQFAGLISVAFPIFWAGAMMLVIFSYYIPIFPRGGSLTPGVVHQDPWSFLTDAMYHAALPIITLTIFSFFIDALVMRNTMVTVLHEDYILTAYAKGLPERTVIFKHAARNAMLPLITRVFAGIGFLITGSIFIENVFSYAGTGSLMVRSIFYRDFPLLQGLFVLITAVTLFSNFIADILYMFLDPRVRYLRG
ncbi:MAG: ABC transporter permease [Candidatus Bathyarchaeia archaeon]